MTQLQIQFKREAGGEGLALPAYQTAGAAGMDVRAAGDCIVAPGETLLVPTGFSMALPPGHEAQLRLRSSVALRQIIMPNAPATIDEDFRGEVKVILFNAGREPFHIERGQRIAQMVIARVERLAVVEVAQLDETARGSGGFGHSGRN